MPGSSQIQSQVQRPEIKMATRWCHVYWSYRLPGDICQYWGPRPQALMASGTKDKSLTCAVFRTDSCIPRTLKEFYLQWKLPREHTRKVFAWHGVKDPPIRAVLKWLREFGAWCCIPCTVQESVKWGVSAAGLEAPGFLAEYKYNALGGIWTQLGPSGFWQIKISQILAVSSSENQQPTTTESAETNSMIRPPRTSDIGISKHRI